ncbi:hypothetical protein [Bdellovibrio sp. HCB288]|uniref:hypothetical protein n=1 Tax=Bdellovibrio sp. HCB288 TaxID=3394355 RepID=UPI0039B400E2
MVKIDRLFIRMEVWNVSKPFKYFVLLLSLLITASGCSLSLELSSLFDGKVTGSINLSQATSLSCTEPNSVGIYSVQNGTISATPIKTASVAGDGKFQIQLEESEEKLLAQERFILQASLCGKRMSRPVTGFTEQTIDISSNLIPLISSSQIANLRTWDQLAPAEITSLLKEINSIQADSSKELFDALTDGSHNELKLRLEQAFNISDIQLIKDTTAPEVQSWTAPNSIVEGSPLTYQASVKHWYYTTATMAYDWRWDGATLTTNDIISIPLTKNSQGTHTLLFQAGFSDGSGGIDTAKGVVSKNLSVKIPNTYPAQVPPTTLVSASPTNSLVASISLNTGASLENCATFSGIAFSEVPTSIGLTAGNFTSSCSIAGTQTYNYTFAPGDGAKSIYVWTRDSSGFISASPQIVSLVLDQTTPALTIGALNSLYRGDQTASISFTATDLTTNITSLKLVVTDDGSAASSEIDITNASSPYSLTLPAISTSKAAVKLVATDEAGNSNDVSSGLFTIDSILPAAPSLSLLTASLTKDSLVNFNILNCTDYSSVLVTESSVTPNQNSSGWIACNEVVPYTHAITGDGTHTIKVWAKDSAGNISATAGTLAVTLDSIAPTLTWVTPTADVSINTAMTVSWKVTDLHTSTAQNTVLSYSTDAGANWTTLSTAALPATSATNQTYSYAMTAPATITTMMFRVTATDSLGNIRTLNRTIVAESEAPELLSLTLAGGNTIVGITSVSAQLAVNHRASPTSLMRLIEGVGPTDINAATWVPFSASAFTFELGKTPGGKTIYAQVKNSAGFESNIISSNITLEFGAPPVITVISPKNSDGPFDGGNAVNIQWTCTTSGSTTLDAAPITISYSADDGVSYQVIAANIANSGSYSWSFPATLTTNSPFKILIACKTAAGVITTGLSELTNTSWKVLVGNPGNMDYGVHINSVDLSAWNAVHGDATNNLYSGTKNGIIRVDRKSGIVDEWLGVLGTPGCPTALSTPANIRFTNPRIVDITNEQMTIVSGPCASITRINISDKSIVWHRVVPEISWKENSLDFYLKKGSGYYYFPSITPLGVRYKFWMLDLSSTSTTAVHIMGTPECIEDLPTAHLNTDAKTAALHCSTASAIVVSPDQQTIKYYLETKTSGMYVAKMEYNSSLQTYIYTSIQATSSNDSVLSRCLQMGSNNSRYVCVNATGQSKRVNYFDTATNAALSANGHDLATFNNSGSMQMSFGASNTAVYAAMNTTNQLFEIKFDADGKLTSTQIGGSPFFTFGNGSDPGKVAFTGIMGMAFYEPTNTLYVRGVNHLRRITLDPATKKATMIDTAMNSNPLGNSGVFGDLAINPAGTIIAANSTNNGLYPWAAMSLSSWTTTLNPATSAYSVSGTTGYFGGGFNDASSLVLGSSFSYTAPYFLYDPQASSTFLSDNAFYFSAATDKNFSQNLWIYRSIGGTITSVAGKSGAAGPSASPTGTSALDTSFSYIYGLQPATADGSGNTDLLVFDSSKLRRVSLLTESANPKVYDVIDFASLPNYPGNRVWSHGVHDTATGWSYLVVSSHDSPDGKSHLWAAHATSGFEEISLAGLNVPGLKATFGKDIGLKITTVGLLMIDSTNKRILIHPLK